MNFRKIMTIVFCMGVFTVGIGGGIMFREYSSFTFGEKIKMYDNQIVREEYRFKLPNDGKSKKIFVDFNHNWDVQNWRAISADYIDKDEIVFDVTYNKAFFTPKIELEELYFENSDSKNNGEKVFSLYYCQNQSVSDLQMVMDHMNIILNGLKNRKVIEFENNYNYDVTIKVAEENLKKITAVNR